MSRATRSATRRGQSSDRQLARPRREGLERWNAATTAHPRRSGAPRGSEALNALWTALWNALWNALWTHALWNAPEGKSALWTHALSRLSAGIPSPKLGRGDLASGVTRGVNTRHVWLRTHGVDTNGAAAKVIKLDRLLGEKICPGTFGKIKTG